LAKRDHVWHSNSSIGCFGLPPTFGGNPLGIHFPFGPGCFSSSSITFWRKIMAIQKNADNGNYFNLHIAGTGYVNCVREVPVKKGENFFACHINALQGKGDDIQYTHFDCRITGSEAESCIKKLQKADNGKRKILIGFKLGNLRPEIFIPEKGTKKGEAVVSLKANLVSVNWAKVDGETVYTAPKPDKKQNPGHPLAA
jgi:hypothetical protein